MTNPVPNLYFLAFDQRQSLGPLFGFADLPTTHQTQSIVAAKCLIYEAFCETQAPESADVGVLVDDTYGSAVAERARREGVTFAVPVERSGQRFLEFEHGEGWQAHVESLDPTYVKVLVRHNPEDDPAALTMQQRRLREISDWTQAQRRSLMVELLVPPTAAQRAAVTSNEFYDREVRPPLMVRAISELQAAGVAPKIWKLEGVESLDACQQIAEQARVVDRDASCIVLGRGADTDLVNSWLTTAAQVDGYGGFAVGRSIWWNAVAEWHSGVLDRSEARRRISERFRGFIETFERARRGAAPS